MIQSMHSKICMHRVEQTFIRSISSGTHAPIINRALRARTYSKQSSRHAHPNLHAQSKTACFPLHSVSYTRHKMYKKGTKAKHCLNDHDTLKWRFTKAKHCLNDHPNVHAQSKTTSFPLHFVSYTRHKMYQKGTKAKHCLNDLHTCAPHPKVQKDKLRRRLAHKRAQ
jgi:hypothetical protein